MVTYLTSDPDIQKPFLREELLLRLAEMLLCVLKQLVSIAVRCNTKGGDVMAINTFNWVG